MLKALDSLTKVIVALAALGAFILSWNNNNRITETNRNVQQVHLTFNSRMEEFIALIKETSSAKGVEKGVKQERARQKEQDEISK